MLAEFQGLRTSLVKTERLPPPVPPNVTTVPTLPPIGPRRSTLATPSTLTAPSPRLELPTPAPGRTDRGSFSPAAEQSYLLTVGVVEGLPVDAVLGWDLPILLDLRLETEQAEGIDSGKHGDVCVNVICPVVTRAQAKDGVQPLPDLDSCLCEDSTKGPRKSRHQRCFEKQLKLPDPERGKTSFNSMWEVPDNIAVLQRGDETLKALFANVLEGPVGILLRRERFVIDNDVLYAVEE